MNSTLNSQPRRLSVSTCTINSPSAEPLSPVAEAIRILRFGVKRRRRGKIAALPPAVRQQINVMLEDGVPYAQVITRLGEAGKGLSEDALSRWFKTYFQDWRETRLLCHIQPSDPTLAGVLTLLTEFDPDYLAPIIKRDPAKFVPFLNAAVRIVLLAIDQQQSTPDNAKPHQIADDFSTQTHNRPLKLGQTLTPSISQ